MSRESRKGIERQLERLSSVLGRHLTTRAKLEVLTFWGRHPEGWCTRRAVAPFTLASRYEIDEALAELVEDRLLQRHQSGDLCLFALAEDGHVRRAVTELARLTPNERRHLLHRARLRGQDGRREPAQGQAAPRFKPQREGANP